MLAKRTTKNQITLPKAVVQATGEAEYYDVTTDSGRFVLTPAHLQQARKVRDKLAAMDITENDIEIAVEWARKAQ